MCRLYREYSDQSEAGDAAEALLSPALFARLRRVFGSVKVGNRGEAWAWRPVNVGRGMKTQSEHPGELYRFNCEHCHDTRHRGWVGHMFGQPDPLTGRPMTWHLGCKHAECFAGNPRLKDEFVLQLLGVIGTGRVLPPCSPGQPAGPRGPVSLPGVTISLADLTDPHPARAYVRERGFDPDELAREYGVGYCLDAPEEHETMALNRLIIPLVRGGQLIGWQARKIGEAGRSKKYYNHAGLSKSGYLYGMDAAEGGRLAILVEGVPSVWSMGPPVMAVLGHPMKPDQSRVLGPIADRGGLVVVMFDPDAAEGAAATCRLLEPMFPARVVVVNLPESVTPAACRRWPVPKPDPGELTSDAAWGIVDAAVSAAGLRIDDFL